MEKEREAERAVHRHGGREHDSENTSRRGMSSDAVAADEAETMASTGDSENAFQEIAAGTATGWGVFKDGVASGVAGLELLLDLGAEVVGCVLGLPPTAGETEFVQNVFHELGARHFMVEYAEDEFLEALEGITDPEAKRSAIGEQFSGRGFNDAESELERSWDALHGENAGEWEEAREAVKDAWERARDRRR